MLEKRLFDNENINKYFIKSHLDSFSYYMELGLYNVSNEIFDIINNDLAITCYGSDSRLDRYNTNISSMDLLICNNNKDIKSDKILDIIKEVISKNKDIIEDNSYIELGDDGEYYEIEDKLDLGKQINILQADSEYIDILTVGDELYKYKGKYFPDRLLDAYFIGGNESVLKSFKYNMLDDIINKPSILTKYKKTIKNYYKEEYIRGKNHRKGFEDSFILNENDGIVKFDNKNYFGFKHGPLRALQYKLIELFLEFIIEKRDYILVDNFPFDIKGRLEFFIKNNFFNLDIDESKELLEIYTFFKNLNLKLEKLFLYKRYDNNFSKIDDNGTFGFVGDEYFIKLNKFIDLFNKI